LDADRFVFTDVANNVSFRLVPGSGLVGQTQAVYTPILDTVTDFDTSGADHDTIDIAHLLNTRTNFSGTTFEQAVSQGYLYFVQHGTPGTADFGTNVMLDTNGGTHFDASNNFGVADLKGVFASEMRADLFLI
jgi:hypothetical protein